MISRNSLFLFFVLNFSLIGHVNSALITNLSFIEPRGVVSPTDSIEVWMRLSLDPLSDPLIFDRSVGPTAGVHPSLIPVEGDVYYPDTYTFKTRPFDVYQGVAIGIGYGYLHNTFINDDGPDEYRFDSNHSSSDAFNLIVADGFVLNPGESLDYLHGTFTPRVDGYATPKDYTFYNASLSLRFFGLSPEGEILNAYVNLATSCPTRDASCSFSRTVSAVPVPAAFYLFSSGLIALVSMVRRKQNNI